MKTTCSCAMSSLVILSLTSLSACDLVGDVADGVTQGVDDVTEGVDDVTHEVDDVAPDLSSALEDAVFAKLECEELARPSTLARLRALLRDPTFEELQALVTNPQDLATVVSMGGAEIEGAVVVARNLELLLRNGTAGALLDGGWDGVACGEPVPFACTAGSERTTVACESDAVSSVAIALDQCTLGGTVHSGDVTFTRDVSEDTATVAFAGLAFDEVKVLDGSLSVAVRDEGVLATLGQRLAYTEHGGPEGGLECGARLSLDALDLDIGTDGGAGESTIAFAGERATTTETLAIATVQPLVVTEACSCPIAGALRIEVPRPLGREGESATAQLTFAPDTSGNGACAQASVALLEWPTACAGDLSGDCSKGATQAVLGSVFSAMCTAL